MLGWFEHIFRNSPAEVTCPNLITLGIRRRKKNQVLCPTVLCSTHYVSGDGMSTYRSTAQATCCFLLQMHQHTNKYHSNSRKGRVDFLQRLISHKSYRLTISKFLKTAKQLHYIMQKLNYRRSHKKVRKVLLSVRINSQILRLACLL